MEVVSILAAVPELLKLAQRLGTAIGHLGSRGSIARTAHGLRAQLELLSRVLESIQQRDGQPKDAHGCADSLVQILDNTRQELDALRILVARVEDTKNNGPKLFNRARLVFSGFESQLSARSQRVDRVVKLLEVYLADSAAQARLEAQVGKLLKPSTSTTNFIPEKLCGTFEWIWTHDNFLQWTGSTDAPRAGMSSSPSAVGSPPDVDDARMLVLYGANGCGKSVLAASIADGLRSKGTATFFFSFWAGHSHDTRADVMFRTVLWHLIQQAPRDRQTRRMSQLIHNKAEVRSTDVVINHIQELCTEHGQEIYIIIDGIDESFDDWNDVKNGPLGGVLKLLQSAPRLRILLSGRQASLRTALQRWPLRIELTPELVKDDMTKLIQHELDSCTHHHEDVKDFIQTELESKSTAMFLWVKLVFKELRLSFSEAEVHHTLSRLPDQLAQEYHRLFAMLSQRLQGRQKKPSVGMQRAKDLLGLIIGAARPMTMTELRTAYVYSSEPHADGKYCQRNITKEAIMDACGDIITLRGELVYLGHTSLREFLVRQPDEVDHDGPPTADYFRLETSSCQRVMALTCLRYLQSISWRGPSGEHHQAKDLEPHFPFLSYASSYIASHFLNSNIGTNELHSNIAAFLYSEGAFSWLEFVVSVENDETRGQGAGLPPSFWEEMVQFSLSQGSIDFAPDRTSPGSGPIAEQILAHGLGYTLISGLECLTDRQDAPGPEASSTSAASPVAAGQPVTQRSHLLITAKEGENSNAESLRLVVDNLVSTSRRLDGHRLDLILPTIQACIRKFDALVSPLDIAAQAFRGMSFFALMALAQSLKVTKPQQAARLGLLALEKVQGKGDLREAWAHGTIGDVHPDNGVCALHYQKSRDILASKSPNPYFDYHLLNLASSQVTCLFSAGKMDDAIKVAKLVEEKLLGIGDTAKREGEEPRESHGKGYHGGTLRRQIYRVIEKNPKFVKNRLKRTVDLGAEYSGHGLHQDANRLLAPLARDPISIRLLGGESATTALEHLRYSACRLGQVDTSVDYWRKKRDLLLAQASDAAGEGRLRREIIKRIDGTTMNLAQSLCEWHRSDLARRELESLTSFAFLIGDQQDDLEFYIAFFIEHRVQPADQAGAHAGECNDAITFIEKNMKHLEDAFVHNGNQKNDAWRFVARSLVSHGRFDEAEGFIRRIS